MFVSPFTQALAAASAACDAFLATAAFGLLPQGDHLLSSRVRAAVQARAVALVTGVYARLYAQVHAAAAAAAAAAGTGPDPAAVPTLLRRTPEQLAALLAAA